jgi:signal transduction histidine kinase
MKIASNGIHIEVNDQGSGTPAIVFLHYYRTHTGRSRSITAAGETRTLRLTATHSLISPMTHKG